MNTINKTIKDCQNQTTFGVSQSKIDGVKQRSALANYAL